MIGFEGPAEWDKFIEETWQQRAATLDGGGEPLAGDADTLRAMKAAASRIASNGRTSAAFRIVVELNDGPVPLTADLNPRALAPFLPSSKDTTLRSYLERVGEALGKRFAVILNHYPDHDIDQWHRARGFVHELGSRVGFPSGRCVTDIFAGNYTRTPFGVHRDEQSVFTWGVLGERRFRVWPLEDLSCPGDGTLDYLDFIDSGQELVAGASSGAMSYWPDTFWHISDRQDEYSATASIGIPMDQGVAKALLGFLRERLSRKCLTAPPSGYGTWGETAVMPEAVAGVLDQVRHELDTNAERKILTQWLELESSGWMGKAPLRDDDSLIGPETPLELARPNAILWAMPTPQHLVVAMNGWILDLPAHPSLIDLVELLREGQAVSAQEMMNSLCGPRRFLGKSIAIGEEDVMGILSFMVSNRSLNPTASALGLAA